MKFVSKSNVCWHRKGKTRRAASTVSLLKYTPIVVAALTCNIQKTKTHQIDVTVREGWSAYRPYVFVPMDCCSCWHGIWSSQAHQHLNAHLVLWVFPIPFFWQGEKKGNASPRAVTSSGVAWDRGIEWQGTWWNQICGASWNGAQGFTPKLPKPGERQPRLWPQSSSKGLRDWIKLVLAYKDGMMVKLGDVNAMQVGLWWHTT